MSAPGGHSVWVRGSRAAASLCAAVRIPWSRERIASQLAPFVAELDEANTLISRISTDTEERFLALSNRLTELTADTETLSCECDRLILLASGDEGGEETLKATGEVLREPLDFIRQWKVQAEILIGHLQRAMGAVDKLVPVETEVRRILGPLPCIHALFGIETAGMGEEVRGIFLKVGDDIQMLLGQVNDAFAQQFATLTTLRRQLAKVVARIHSAASSEFEEAEQQRSAITQAMSAVAEDVRKKKELDRRFTTMVKGISGEVGRIVVALQSQDRMSQRLAHVLDALNTIGKEGRDLSLAGPERELELVNILFKTSRVEAAQMQCAADDMADARQSFEAAVRGALDQIVEAETKALAEVPESTASIRGIVQVLLDMTHGVRSLTCSVRAVAEEAASDVEPLSALAANLNDTIGELAHRMRLIALNAQVQAVRLGERTALEVLSAEAAGISQETSTTCEAAANEISLLVDCLSTDLCEFAQLREQASRIAEDLSLRALQNDQRLHNYRDSTLATLERLETTVKKTHKTAESMLDLLDFDKQVGEKLSEIQRSLQGIEITTCEWLERRKGAGGSEHLVALERNYTMSSERDVHAAILGGGIPAPQLNGESTGIAAGELEVF